MKMDRLTITQRIKIIQTYFKNGDSATAAYRALREDYGLYNRPTMQTIDEIVKKIEVEWLQILEGLYIIVSLVPLVSLKILLL